MGRRTTEDAFEWLALLLLVLTIAARFDREGDGETDPVRDEAADEDRLPDAGWFKDDDDDDDDNPRERACA